MIIKRIVYSRQFQKEFRKLPGNITETVIIKEKIFKDNPLHPSLRLHQLHGKLKGYWSIAITSNYRIIFQREENGDILFGSIGKHDIYNTR